MLQQSCHHVQLEKAAVEKWGSMPEVEAERNAREQKRLKRALEHAGSAPCYAACMIMNCCCLTHVH